MAFKTKGANRSNNRSLLTKIFGKGGHLTICFEPAQHRPLQNHQQNVQRQVICVSIVDVFEVPEIRLVRSVGFTDISNLGIMCCLVFHRNVTIHTQKTISTDFQMPMSMRQRNMCVRIHLFLR